MDSLPTSILIPNRGEIARRIVRTTRAMGIRAVVAHSDVDSDLPCVLEADSAVCLGPAAPKTSYLDRQRVLTAAEHAGCDAIHPGYGFLSESPDFAQEVQDAGLTWIGPSPRAIRHMSDKIRARQMAAEAGVPVSNGTGGALDDVGDSVRHANSIGYPVMLKAAAGGGGIGMVRADTEHELRKAYESTRTAAQRYFGSSEVFVERYISAARHIEVQLLGLNDGTVLGLGERDCSTQRRHQKIVEEAPASGVSPELRDSLINSAIRIAKAIDYRGAGTVEFLVDGVSGEYVFLEMNTRLQVEHPVTEMTHGIDLVEEQIRVARGASPTDACARTSRSGSALEFRICAEDSVRFLPSPGRIQRWDEPVGPGIRVDAGYAAGNAVTVHYDPLLAKLCVYGDTRHAALARAQEALTSFHIEGIKTNLDFLRALVVDPAFHAGEYDTTIVDQVLDRSAREATKG